MLMPTQNYTLATTHPLTLLFEFFFLRSFVPDTWTLSRVTLVYKKVHAPTPITSAPSLTPTYYVESWSVSFTNRYPAI